MKPQFVIIAGPNGAGKSLYGHIYVPAGTEIFNGDLIFAGLVKKYPAYDPQKLAGGVPMQLEKDKDYAIKNRLNFGFETNYANDMASEISLEFKHAGYESTLLYFGLNDLENSRARVKTRFALGGHNVPIDTINFNMKEGIRRVRENLGLYDHILFADTSVMGTAPIIAYYHKVDNELKILDDKAKWFEKKFVKSLAELERSRSVTLDKTNYLGIKRKRGTELDGGLGL